MFEKFVRLNQDYQNDTGLSSQPLRPTPTGRSLAFPIIGFLLSGSVCGTFDYSRNLPLKLQAIFVIDITAVENFG
jgi:hypothetical protein